MLGTIFEAGRKLDHAVYRKLGIHRLVEAIKPKLPPSLIRFGGRYGPVIAIVLLVALYAMALSGTQGVTTDDDSQKDALERFTGIPGGETDLGPTTTAAADAQAQETAEQTAAKAREIARQFVAPPTANVCGKNNILDTGDKVQFPWAVQCTTKFSGDNGGETYRGVYRDKIRMAWYYSDDPVVVGGTRIAGGCAQFDCSQDYMQTYVSWFLKYYETYGRKIELVPIRGKSDSEGNLARQDAEAIVGINPPVFGVLGGPGQAAPSYVARLKDAGIMCIGCGVSLPQEFSEGMAPFAWGTLQSSTQAYIHRAEYVGKRLAPFPADHAVGLQKGKPRSFGLVWFNNTGGDYKSGVDFFEKELKEKYGVSLASGAKIEYTNVEGCQINASAMVSALKASNNGQGVTSVIFSGDPLCPIDLTKQAEIQSAQWEWIITGSLLTDTNNFGRLYDQNQWSRAFGVSMLSPDVKNQNDYWYKMYKEMKPAGEPLEEAPIVLGPPIMFFTGVHLAGAKLTPETFAAGMAKAVPIGGTVTIGRRSYGPKKIGAHSLLDYTSFDDMTEIWWDRNQVDPNGRTGAYWYVDGGQRHQWYTWPGTKPKAFSKEGAIFGYEKAPDQS